MAFKVWGNMKVETDCRKRYKASGEKKRLRSIVSFEYGTAQCCLMELFLYACCNFWAIDKDVGICSWIWRVNNFDWHSENRKRMLYHSTWIPSQPYPNSDFNTEHPSLITSTISIDKTSDKSLLYSKLWHIKAWVLDCPNQQKVHVPSVSVHTSV